MKPLELAKLCKAIYTDEIFGEECGGQGAYCQILSSNPAVIVFRGSRDVAGWVDDADVRWSPHPYGYVHTGFLHAWESIRRQVQKVVGSSPVILTGHSLGGALATIAAPDLRVQEIVTFGSPRVGDKIFAEWFASITTRHVWKLDPVPFLPGYLSGFRHGTTPKWNSGDGWQDGMDFKHLFYLFLRQAANLVLTYGDWKAWIHSLWADHAIDNYVGAL